MSKKEQKKNWATINTVLVIFVLLGAILAGYAIYVMKSSSATQKVLNENAQYAQVLDADVQELNALKNQYNNAPDFDSAVAAANNFARAYAIKKPHFETYLNFIDTKASALREAGVDVIRLRRIVQDDVSIYNDVASSMKNQIEAYTAQQQAKQQGIASLIQTLAGLLI